MDTVLQDLRYSARKLLHAPGFTVVAVATLAIAIGATTAIFSIVNGVLLKPPPFRNPEQVVFVASSNREGLTNPMSTLDFIDYRDQSKSFVGMAAMYPTSLNSTSEAGEPARVSAAQVGARFFELLGVDMALGRGFREGEDKNDAPRVAVLSHTLWRNNYGSDPRIVGQIIRLDGQQYTIVGVAPVSLTFPARVEVYVPFVFEPWQVDPGNRGAHSHYAIGRLKDGVSVETANAEVDGIAQRLARQYPESNTGFGGKIVQLQEQIVGKTDKPLYALFGAVLLVLFIACANVANLLLVRASARESEMAVRAALGAGRSRIIRQLVTESSLLALAGAAVGAVLASWAVSAVVAFGPTGLPRLAEVVVDAKVLAFSGGLAILTGIAFGLVPAIQAARPNVAQMLRESVRGSSRGRAQRTRILLVVSEMALSVMLLVGAGLLIRSFVRLINVDPGFKPENVVAFNVSLPATKYQLEHQIRTLAAQMTERMEQLPGSRAVGVTFGRPLDNSGLIRTTFEVDGTPPSTPQNRKVSQVHMTSPGYFKAMGVPLLRGRFFTQDENRIDAPPVIVVSQEFARRWFPNEEVLGKHVKFGITHDTGAVGKGQMQVQGEIVGVVGDVKARDLTTPAYPAAYVPFNMYAIGFFSVLVRTDAEPATVQSRIQSAVRELDADLPIFGLTTMSKAVSDSVAQPRFYMVLLTAFAAIALLLAALGIYGVTSYTVSQRTRELGIRVALGATRTRIVRSVIGQGAWMAVAGVVIGVVASLAGTKMLANMIFGVGRFDPIAMVVAPLTLIAIALLGCYIPARRAAGVDPVTAMRND
jgi:putative ABC transport system permease protein